MDGDMNMIDPSPAEIIDLLAQNGRDGRQQLFDAQIPDKIAKLCAALRLAESAVVRQVICNLMASLQQAEALPCLLATLEDPSSKVVAAAEDAIGNCSAENEISEPLRTDLGKRLIQFLSDPGSDSSTKTGAIYALGLMRFRDAAPYLLAALESPVPSMRWCAAEGLSYIGDSKAVAYLKDRLDRESDERVKRYIRMSLKSLAS
jgi:HEAT repeat protein